MAKIDVDGYGKLKVLGSLGYVHDVGMHVKEVELPDGSPAKVVKRGSTWQRWTARDRTAPLREAAAKGWPKETPR
jgi:hypothetical protein